MCEEKVANRGCNYIKLPTEERLGKSVREKRETKRTLTKERENDRGEGKEVSLILSVNLDPPVTPDTALSDWQLFPG